MFVATLIAAGKLTDEVVREAIDRLDATGHDVGAPHWLDVGDAADIVFEGSLVSARAELALMDHGSLDTIVQPQGDRTKKLIIADMDSTMITVECIDELADEAGVGARVAEITKAAMNGELDFEAALRERVGLLKGLPVAVIDRVIRDRITLIMEIEDRAGEGRPLEMIGIVRARNDKSGRNGSKFSFLTVSDPTGERDVTVYSEALNQYGDLLRPGKAVAMTVSVKQNGEETRLIMERAIELESARLSKPSGQLVVRLSSGANPSELAGVVRRLEGLSDPDRGSILLEMPLEDGRLVTVKLPQIYTISLKAQRALKEIPGVERVIPRRAA